MKTEKEIKEKIMKGKRTMSISDDGRKLFKSTKWKLKGEIDALEWVLQDSEGSP